jgi:hypothetical protein
VPSLLNAVLPLPSSSGSDQTARQAIRGSVRGRFKRRCGAVRRAWIALILIAPFIRTADAQVSRGQDTGSVPGKPPVFSMRDGHDVSTPLVVVRTPTNGTVVSPGQTVKVKLDPVPGTRIGMVQLYSRGDPSVASFTSLPATVRLTVPDEAAGDFTFLVISVTPDNGWAPPIETTLRVAVQAALQSFEVLPTTMWFRKPGEEAIVYVSGQYADGVKRDLEKSGTGTSYVSSAPSVVTVSKDGRVRAQGNGQAVVKVANGGFSADIAVSVAPDPPNNRPPLRPWSPVETPLPRIGWFMIYAPMSASRDGTFAVHREAPVKDWPISAPYSTRTACEQQIRFLRRLRSTPGTPGTIVWAIQTGEARCIPAMDRAKPAPP